MVPSLSAMLLGPAFLQGAARSVLVEQLRPMLKLAHVALHKPAEDLLIGF